MFALFIPCVFRNGKVAASIYANIVYDCEEEEEAYSVHSPVSLWKMLLWREGVRAAMLCMHTASDQSKKFCLSDLLSFLDKNDLAI